MLKKLWSWIVFEWKYPYGFCEVHKMKKERFLGCEECCRIAWKKVDRDIREEKIEIIKEAILRAKKEDGNEN